MRGLDTILLSIANLYSRPWNTLRVEAVTAAGEAAVDAASLHTPTAKALPHERQSPAEALSRMLVGKDLQDRLPERAETTPSATEQPSVQRPSFAGLIAPLDYKLWAIKAIVGEAVARVTC